MRRAGDVGLVVEVPVPGGPEALMLRKKPISAPRPGEVLIQVHAAGVNRADIKQRQGDYPVAGLQVSATLGLEVAGIVVAVADDVAHIKVGDRVCALLADGGYAEYCVASALLCMRIPDGLDFIAAAALPENFFIVWLALFEQAELKPGETVLVQGGSSGIGITAIQLATAFGSQAIATAGTADKCKACINAGAVLAINYREEDFAERVLAHTDSAGVDVVLDMVGAPYAARHVQALASGGRLCYVAGDLGQEASFTIRAIMLKHLKITGVTLRHRPVAEKARIRAMLVEKVWPMIDSGRIAPVVDRVFPLQQAADAHRALESGRTIGKIVLRVA
jgi:putative PIG3 family NAD(P)H quinone oxidoreductase